MSRMFDPEPCKRCKKMIERGDMRHSLVEATDQGPMHYRCALEHLTGLCKHDIDAELAKRAPCSDCFGKDES